MDKKIIKERAHVMAQAIDPKVLHILTMILAAMKYNSMSLGITYSAYLLAMHQIHAPLIYQYGMKRHVLANAAKTWCLTKLMEMVNSTL